MISPAIDELKRDLALLVEFKFKSIGLLENTSIIVYLFYRNEPKEITQFQLQLQPLIDNSVALESLSPKEELISN